MAHLTQQQYSYQQSTSKSNTSVDNKISPTTVYGFEEEATSSILDPAILDSEMMQNPTVAHYRKDSFANSTGIISPAESHTWNTEYTTAPGAWKVESSQYVDDLHLQHHRRIPHDWSDINTAATTGTISIPQYSNMQYTDRQPVYEHHPVLHGDYIAQQVQTPGIPPPKQDWMALAQAEVESRPHHKRLRSNSPTKALVDIHRREGGIHKKNKRIDIPQERNIDTIDTMIENTKDEDLLKELKAQKRLLRNREAALASRQRKKKHTEDLESKEKDHQTQVTVLENRIEDLLHEQDEFNQQRQILMHRVEEAQRFAEALQMEKRDMLMKHTEETASLRRKVQLLTEQLDAAPLMSAAPSSTGFTDFNADMEALNMGHDWDSFLFLQDTQHNDNNEVTFTPRAEVKSSEKTLTPQAEPVASGLLFMLLLCGAFVASKPASMTGLQLPPMPADVRAAAPTVLHNLLSEGGSTPDLQQPILQDTRPTRSIPRTVNRMTQMHRSLTAPTRQQEIDSAFALTPAQYASLTNVDMPMHEAPTSEPRRALAQTLAEHRLPSNENKAEIYTRSLLWEHIPTEVVNQFKELVRDHHELMNTHHI